jgi:hypothetical protein
MIIIIETSQKLLYKCVFLYINEVWTKKSIIQINFSPAESICNVVIDKTIPKTKNILMVKERQRDALNCYLKGTWNFNPWFSNKTG